MNSHRDLCKIAAQWLLDQTNIDLVCYEIGWQRGFVDAIGLTTKETNKQQRLVVVEVKRTRADLLQDLRKGKMLKYQNKASHCYLAGTSEALAAQNKSPKEILDDLRKKGLPVGWGVLLLPTTGNGPTRTLRGARRLRPPHPKTIRTLTRQIARSYMYRIFSDTSPMSDEVDDD